MAKIVKPSSAAAPSDPPSDPISTPYSAAPIPDPFAPEQYLLPQTFAETAGVRKLLTTVPVRRPSPQDFFRAHSGEEWRRHFPVIELKEDREEYLVHPSLLPELGNEIVPKTLFVTINRQAVVSFWPVRLPGADGKDMPWWSSSRDAAEKAMESWIRIKANQSLGAYEIFEATAEWGEPEWPEGLDYWGLIGIAFKDRRINDLDHPVVKRLFGRA